MAKKTIEKIKCTCCGKEQRLSEYYKSASKMYTNNNEKIPICKSCMKDRYTQLLNYYNGDAKLSLKHLCLNLDIFFFEKLFIECSAKDDVDMIGEYMRLLSRKETKDKTSVDNLMIDESENKKIAIGNELVDEEIIDFWGEGYSSKEYIRLEKKYKKYTKHYPSESLQEQEIIKSLCELEIMKENCRLSGDKNGYNKVNTQIRKSMDDLNVLPSKMQKYGEDKNITIGKLIETIEKEEPIPDIHPEFEDIDKIKWMLDRYFINPFKKVFGLDDNLSYEDVENDTYEDSKK